MKHFFDQAPARAYKPRPAQRAKAIIAVVIALLVLVGVGWFAAAVIAKDYAAGTAAEPVTVTIASGSTLTDIGATLADAGVVESQKAFVRAARTDPGRPASRPATTSSPPISRPNRP